MKVLKRWAGMGGYAEFLKIAFPLILATGSWSLQNFIDRIFLTWYSPAAVAAAMPAGLMNLTLLCLFQGTVSYVDVFIAQYYGAGRKEMSGPIVWQGLFLALAGALAVLATLPFAGAFFAWVGHAPEVLADETVYFRVLGLGAFPALASCALAGFFAGRGETWTLMWVNVLGTAVNVVFDYLLIFGYAGFPELGILGAGLATVFSAVATMIAYLALMLRKKERRECRTAAWRPDWALLGRLIRFGLPNGVNFTLDIAGFTMFLLFIGTLGTVNLAATNIALNINMVAFMPMLGSGIAVSVLVGQYLGKNQPHLAERSTISGFHLSFGYMLVLSSLYLAAPGWFIKPFAAKADPGSFEQIQSLVIVLLRFVAVYSLFDTLSIIFSSAVKGAGDTHFVMRVIAGASILVLVLPSYLALKVWHLGLFAGWAIASAYVILLGVVFWLRFRQGKWKHMRVIEPNLSAVAVHRPDVPVSEF